MLPAPNPTFTPSLTRGVGGQAHRAGEETPSAEPGTGGLPAPGAWPTAGAWPGRVGAWPSVRGRGLRTASLKIANPRARSSRGPRLPPLSGERRIPIGQSRVLPARGRVPRGGGKAAAAAFLQDAGEPQAPERLGLTVGSTMDAAEVEFLAEKELVTIIPNFSLDKIYLIGGDLGPFNPGLPVQVPLWLAINLKQRQKCRLLAPEWMDVEKLEKMRDHERKEDTFTPAPNPHYTELTKLLLNHASDNIPKADEIRTLIKDVWDTRVAKLRVSADSFVRQQEAHAKLDNLTLMEVNAGGAFLTRALSHMFKLRTNLQPADSAPTQDL
uniref:GINS complex subunit 2 n=3 Tax=Sus scrofa TaxID=9823 RepID=A0A4X1T7T3_PIG